MKDIILNEERDACAPIEVDLSSEVVACEPSEVVPCEPCELEATKEAEHALTKKSKEKQPKALVILSIVFTSLSLLCAISGIIPLQLLFIALGLIFYMVDRKKNGKRGIPLLGMVCTLATFVIIFITLVYSILLLCFGIYTVYINPEPYNFVMGIIKGIISWFLGIFGINFNF